MLGIDPRSAQRRKGYLPSARGIAELTAQMKEISDFV